MRRTVLALTLIATGCASSKPAPEPVKETAPQAEAPAAARPAAPLPSPQELADTFLKGYLADLARLELQSATATWTASNSGKKEDFDASAKADLELRMLHADAARLAELQRLLALKDKLSPEAARSLEVAELSFKANGLPKDTLQALSSAQAEIEQGLKTFRAEVAGKKLTRNDLVEILHGEKDPKKRQAAWEASKAVGAVVAPKVVALAKLRNQAARSLGYENFWDMQIRLQEHDPKQVLALFDELERLTDAPFKAMKASLDAEIARKFKVKPEQLMPWHYTNPFFQDAPPMEKADLDEFFKSKKKEDVVAIAQKFYDDIGLDARPVLAKSDFYEREGKDQHAFCITFDRQEDVRVLVNIKPTGDWMETTLHELGHALYYLGIDRGLTYNLRESAHQFTTEAVAMLFGALAKNPLWLKEYAGADAKKVAAMEKLILEQRRREQLIFVRWGLVMLRFEHAFYADPDQDLTRLWYSLVEKLQGLKAPPGRVAPDWAAKDHIAVYPVYYQNYVMGELFAAQLRAQFAKLAGHTGPTSSLSFNGKKEYGTFLVEKVFKPGMRARWPQFVEAATGAPLSPAAFAAEVK